MYLTLNLNQINTDFIYINEPIKNNIINDGYFYRILYSTDLFTTNGIHILLNINFINIEKYYNKYKCIFDVSYNKNLIDNIKNIENQIIEKINIDSKRYNLNIYDQLNTGIIKTFIENNNNLNNTNLNNTNLNSNLILLKISGIWETSTEYGITYKFIKL
jgi:hypothetical protein